MDKFNINPDIDHSPRFERSKSDIDKANEAIRNLSKLKKEEAGVAVEVVGDRIIHKRTEEDYDKIWAKFCMQEESDFFEILFYGALDINRIGIKKFIDAQDWRNEEDVSKWRTDKAQVIICLHCCDDFAPIQFAGSLGLNGLCPKCAKLYDLDKIDRVAKIKSEDKSYDDIGDAGVKFAIARTRVMEQFVLDNLFRKEFLASPTK